MSKFFAQNSKNGIIFLNKSECICKNLSDYDCLICNDLAHTVPYVVINKSNSIDDYGGN